MTGRHRRPRKPLSWHLHTFGAVLVLIIAEAELGRQNRARARQSR